MTIMVSTFSHFSLPFCVFLRFDCSIHDGFSGFRFMMTFFQGIQKPAWLEALYTQKFFVGCSFHETAKKNEKNICCLDCCISICPHCISSHRFHRLLQVRRYVYHDVVRLEDLQKLIDCSNVQVSILERF